MEAMRFIKIDSTFLPGDIAALQRQGLHIDFYSDGQLKLFERYDENGREIQVLHLAEGQASARSGSSEQYDRYYDGGWERYDAWIDHFQHYKEDWDIWIKKQIESIYNFLNIEDGKAARENKATGHACCS